MPKKLVAALVVSALVAPAFLSGSLAVGSIQAPLAAESSSHSIQAKDSDTNTDTAQMAAAKISQAKEKKKPSLMKRLSDRFARFRPVEHNTDFNAVALNSKATIDEIFDKDMSQRLAAQYAGTVAPLERETITPNRWASRWELERYEQSRKDLANWTVKEVGKDQLDDFIRTRRQTSSAIDAIALGTGKPREEEKAPQAVEQQRAAYAQRSDAPAAKEEEPSIPTRLKAKLNVLKTRGQLTFSNPIVMTSVEAKAGSGENLAVEMNRDIRSLNLFSRVRYGVDESLMNVTVNHRISDEVSLDLNSERWIGSKRGASGEKKRETAKVVYSLSF